MYWSDLGFPWDPFYRVEVVGWYVVGRANLVAVRGWDKGSQGNPKSDQYITIPMESGTYCRYSYKTIWLFLFVLAVCYIWSLLLVWNCCKSSLKCNTTNLNNKSIICFWKLMTCLISLAILIWWKVSFCSLPCSASQSPTLLPDHPVSFPKIIKPVKTFLLNFV